MVCMEAQLENSNVQGKYAHQYLASSVQTGTLNKHEKSLQSYEKINHIMQKTFVQKRDNMFIFLVYEIIFFLYFYLLYYQVHKRQLGYILKIPFFRKVYFNKTSQHCCLTPMFVMGQIVKIINRVMNNLIVREIVRKINIQSRKQ